MTQVTNHENAARRNARLAEVLTIKDVVEGYKRGYEYPVSGDFIPTTRRNDAEGHKVLSQVAK